jgi:hypothetical protein
MTARDFEKMKMIERQTAAMAPIIELLKEGRALNNFGEETYKGVVNRIQKIGQELLDLIQDGLL